MASVRARIGAGISTRREAPHSNARRASTCSSHGSNFNCLTSRAEGLARTCRGYALKDDLEAPRVPRARARARARARSLSCIIQASALTPSPGAVRCLRLLPREIPEAPRVEARVHLARVDRPALGLQDGAARARLL